MKIAEQARQFSEILRNYPGFTESQRQLTLIQSYFNSTAFLKMSKRTNELKQVPQWQSAKTETNDSEENDNGEAKNEEDENGVD